MDKFVKDPDAVLDYTWDWADFLQAGESIVTHAVTSDTAELDVDSTTADATSITAWLSGGEDYQRALVTCHITTDQGREDDRSIYIQVRNR